MKVDKIRHNLYGDVSVRYSDDIMIMNTGFEGGRIRLLSYAHLTSAIPGRRPCIL